MEKQAAIIQGKYSQISRGYTLAYTAIIIGDTGSETMLQLPYV